MGTNPWHLLSDEELLAATATGTHGAFNELMSRHMYAVHKMIYTMRFDQTTADDVAQETWLKVWKNAAKFDPSKNTKFTTWMYQIAMNVSIDHKRKLKMFSDEELPEIADNSPPREEVIDENRRQRHVQLAIQSLPVRQRSALTLCYFQGISQSEAAVILGTSVKAIESLLIRAKQALRQQLAPYMYDGENRHES